MGTLPDTHVPHWSAGVHNQTVSVLLQCTSLTVFGMQPMKCAASNKRFLLVLSYFGKRRSAQGSAVQGLYTADWPDVTACAGGAAATTADAPNRNALQLQLQELSLDNVDALEALKLNIQVSSVMFHITLALCRHHPVTRALPSCHMSALSWLLMKCELLRANMVSRRQCCVFCCNTANWLMLTRLLTCSHA